MIFALHRAQYWHTVAGIQVKVLVSVLAHVSASVSANILVNGSADIRLSKTYKNKKAVLRERPFNYLSLPVNFTLLAFTYVTERLLVLVQAGH